ncbi:MAG: SDR family oxidoreductase [Bacteroidetes bacterium]|nr:SDR family oxidoreductase [Bacteroidota bacterium]MCH8244953.1 SDR family oxidoreductase [Bacteroidota bacterium]
MKIDLSNTNILVTGASRGIGRAISLALGGAGARVAVHYRKEESKARKVAEEAGNGSSIFRADLGDVSACQNLFSSVVDSFGSVDVLVNNAGISINSPLDMESDAWVRDWDATMNINLRAPGLLSRAAIDHFQKKDMKGGRIIHIASRAAFRGDTEDCIAYAASKGGVVSMSRSIARAFGKQNITSFVIAPGFVRTDMAQGFIDAYGEDFVSDGLALNRLTEPEDIAPTVVLLASGLADHATGTSIDINAGSYVH